MQTINVYTHHSLQMKWQVNTYGSREKKTNERACEIHLIKHLKEQNAHSRSVKNWEIYENVKNGTHRHNIYIKWTNTSDSIFLRSVWNFAIWSCVHCRLINEFAGNDFFEMVNANYISVESIFVHQKSIKRNQTISGGKNHCFEVLCSLLK